MDGDDKLAAVGFSLWTISSVRDRLLNNGVLLVCHGDGRHAAPQKQVEDPVHLE